MKNFDDWNNKKKNLESSNRKIIFKTQQIWWCSLGKNIGDEEDGKNEDFERPVLIFRKFNKNLLFILPLSSKIKENNEYYFNFKNKEKDNSVILSQGRTISNKRLLRYLNKLSRGKFNEIKNKFKIIMNL